MKQKKKENIKYAQGKINKKKHFKSKGQNIKKTKRKFFLEKRPKRQNMKQNHLR